MWGLFDDTCVLLVSSDAKKNSCKTRSFLELDVSKIAANGFRIRYLSTWTIVLLRKLQLGKNALVWAHTPLRCRVSLHRRRHTCISPRRLWTGPGTHVREKRSLKLKHFEGRIYEDTQFSGTGGIKNCCKWILRILVNLNYCAFEKVTTCTGFSPLKRKRSLTGSLQQRLKQIQTTENCCCVDIYIISAADQIKSFS